MAMRRGMINRKKRTNEIAHKVFEDVSDNGPVGEYLDALIDGLMDRGDSAGAKKLAALADSLARWAAKGYSRKIPRRWAVYVRDEAGEWVSVTKRELQTPPYYNTKREADRVAKLRDGIVRPIGGREAR